MVDEVVDLSLEYRPDSRTRMWKDIRSHVEMAAAELR